MDRSWQSGQKLTLVADVPTPALEEPAEHVACRFGRNDGLTAAQSLQLKLNLFRKALILHVLQAQPFHHGRSLDMMSYDMGKKLGFLSGVGLP